MKKLNLAILQNEVADDHLLWIEACRAKKEEVNWSVVDITRSGWLETLLKGSFDGLLATPPGWTTPFKMLFDERISILNSICNIPVYPSLEEILIYENKRYLSYWLSANNIPHPVTKVFYYKQEALDYLISAHWPVVAKTSIGAGGSGVVFLHNAEEAKTYTEDVFSGKGIRRQTGPKWRSKGFAGRVLKKLMNPSDLIIKLKKYRHSHEDIQKDFVLFQQFIPHTYEWRCVRIGDSFFAHKKLKRDDKASGSLLKAYDHPPFDLLDFVKEITDKRNFRSQAVDLFTDENGRYLVNEMQCIFGQSDPYQMLINGQPGRYVFRSNEWMFEAGDFNRYESHLLRLEDFIFLLSQHQHKALNAQP